MTLAAQASSRNVTAGFDVLNSGGVLFSLDKVPANVRPLCRGTARTVSTTWLPELGSEMIITLSRTKYHAIIITEGIHSERNKTGHIRVIQRKK